MLPCCTKIHTFLFCGMWWWLYVYIQSDDRAEKKEIVPFLHFVAQVVMASVMCSLCANGWNVIGDFLALFIAYDFRPCTKTNNNFVNVLHSFVRLQLKQISTKNKKRFSSSDKISNEKNHIYKKIVGREKIKGKNLQFFRVFATDAKLLSVFMHKQRVLLLKERLFLCIYVLSLDLPNSS